MMENKIADICEDILGERVGIEQELIVSGLLDSYGIMELISALEDEYMITFVPQEISELRNYSNVKCIAKLVKKKIDKNTVQEQK